MTQVIIQPDATAGVDTYIASEQASANFGVDGSLIVGSDHPAKVYGYRRALIRFDLRFLIGVASIDGVELIFQGYNNLTSPQTFYLRRCTRGASSGTPWTELGTTWQKYDGTNNWTTPGGDYTTNNQHTGIFSAGQASPFAFTSFPTEGLGLLVIDAITSK